MNPADALREAAHRRIGDEVIPAQHHREATAVHDRGDLVAHPLAGPLDVDRNGGHVPQIEELHLRRPLEPQVAVEVDKATRRGVHEEGEHKRSFPDRLGAIRGPSRDSFVASNGTPITAATPGTTSSIVAGGHF